jgi:hypothetical protein
MPFCPSCKYEYEPGVNSCPDCGVNLVDKLADDTVTGPDEDEFDWVPIARIMSAQVAEMVVEAFQAKEIPTLLFSGTGFFGKAGMMGPSSYQAVGGGYTIMVAADSIDDADHEGEVILGEEWKIARLLEIDSSEEERPS